MATLGDNVTHYACQAQLAKLGKGTPCCDCTNHDCVKQEIKEAVKKVVDQYGDALRKLGKE